MTHRIQKAAVIGAGVMGSGIAGHLANAGIPVILLDIVPPNPAPGEDTTKKSFRNRFANSALENFKKQKPAPLTTAKALSLIEVGNIDDDLAKIAECDWVVEVVKEDIAVKRALFAKVEKHLKPGAIISSNTSGLTIQSMLEGRTPAFQQHFMVTHFFNPVRYMKLLEIVAGPQTKPELVAAMAQFMERKLGKGVVYAKDTTNFIANRIGVYGIMRTIVDMEKDGLTIEEVDKIFGPAMGRPKSAVFRTADVVGLDTLMHVTQNCYDSLTKDEMRDVFKIPAAAQELVNRKWLGDKTGQGFYKKQKGDGGKEILVLDLKSLEYRAQNKVRYDSLGGAKDIESIGERVKFVMTQGDKASKFAEKVTLDVLAYASRRLGEIADDLVNIDNGMKWGFGWDIGPFETWDAYGVEAGLKRMAELGIQPAPWVADMVKSGRTSFYGVDKVTETYFDVGSKAAKPLPQLRKISVAQLRREKKVIKENDSATLWDIGDSVSLLEFHSKMNSIDDQIIDLMKYSADYAERFGAGLVIGNDGGNFSAGANLMMLLMAINSGDFDTVKKIISDFQSVNQRLHYLSVPVVTAPHGLTLGGGAEVTMAGHAVQAACETYMGLVEVGVGLIPGGTGNLQLLRNIFGGHAGSKDIDPLPFVKKTFLSIGMAKVATSAEEAKEAGFLLPSDGISMGRDAQLSDAKARVLGMAQAGFQPPRKNVFYLPGRSGAATLDAALYDMVQNKQISDYDRHVGKLLARVLTGGDIGSGQSVTEERLIELETEVFLSLCGEEKSQARMMFMLEKGKPLRN